MLRPLSAYSDWARNAPGAVKAFVALMVVSAIWGFVRPGVEAWVGAAFSVALAYLIARPVVIVWQVWGFVLILAVIGGVLNLITTPAVRRWPLWLTLGHAVLSLVLLFAPLTRRYMLGDPVTHEGDTRSSTPPKA